MSFDVESLRAQFPILSRQVNGKPLIYLDSAASAQKPRAVIEAMTRTMEHAYANVHRGLHTLANETTEAYEQARKSLARFINAAENEIVFTKGATEAINLVAAGLGQSLKAGDEIVLTEMEHHANIVPWHFLRERLGVVLKFVPVHDDGTLAIDAYRHMLTERTRLVGVSHMSNVLGTVNPVAEITRLAHAAGALVLVDGCQSVVHMPVDVKALDVDFYAFSGHKLYGPTGIGALYGKAEALAALPPYQGGGEMIGSVSLEAITYADPPHRFEAGTPAILEAIGLGAAIEWLMAQDREAIA
ncbi:MAG TPA: cysteine desulfurase, partial [Phenylobacterium sp.]|nr:cysteine desulfurase [Phenylobacterium sp.]